MNAMTRELQGRYETYHSFQSIVWEIKKAESIPRLSIAKIPSTNQVFPTVKGQGIRHYEQSLKFNIPYECSCMRSSVCGE
jgi:hypothetical protein